MIRRSRTDIAVLALVLLLPVAPVAAQQPAPPSTTPGPAQTLLDRTQCLAETERFGRSLIDQIERETSPGEARNGLKATVEKVQEMLRNACVTASSLPADEALAVTEKLAEAVLQAVRALRAARDGRELSEEQRRALETLSQQLRLDELGAWLLQFSRFGLEEALREFEAARRTQRFCFADFCIVPDRPEPGEPRRYRWRDQEKLDRF